MEPANNTDNPNDNSLKESSIIVTNKSNSRSSLNNKPKNAINIISQNPNEPIEPNPKSIDPNSPSHAQPTVIIDPDTAPYSRPTSIASSPSR